MRNDRKRTGERVTVTDLRTNEVASIVHNVGRDIAYDAVRAAGRNGPLFQATPKATRMIVCETLFDDGSRTRLSTWYA